MRIRKRNFKLDFIFIFSFLFLFVKFSDSAKISLCDQWDICSQTCEEPNTTSNGKISSQNATCTCLEGFRVGENDPRSCTPNEPNVLIAYALRSSVRILDVNAGKTVKIVEDIGQTVGVAVDFAGGFVYWTDVAQREESVHRAPISGDGPIETIVDTGLLLPEGIAFDWVTGNIYITDSNRTQIIACAFVGKKVMCTVLVKQYATDKPREIALHPGDGLMFWTDWGQKSAIIRAWMDGSTATPIVTDEIKWPNSLAVDQGRNRLYWSDAFHDKIETSTLIGSDRQLVNMEKVHHPFSLEVFGDLIIWSDWELKTIQSCSKFACKDNLKVLVNATTPPNGIAIAHAAAQPTVRPNPCKSKCSHICVLSGKLGSVCKCPSGYKLDLSKKNCIDDEAIPKILIGHDNTLKILRFDSIGRDIDVVEETKLKELKTIGAVHYNPVNNTIFISDTTWKTIYEYSPIYKAMKPVVNRHVESVKSLALDVVSENLYWVDSSKRRIEVMSCRTGAQAVISNEADHPQSIVIVPEERYLFVSLTGRRGGRILRMNMNGYNRRTLYRSGRDEPLSLTYNSELKQIFWVENTDSIQHISINGRSQAATERYGSPYGLTNFGNRLFWSDRHTQLLHTLTIYGADMREPPLFIGHKEDKYANETVESYILGNFLASLAIMHRDLNVYENLTRNHQCSTARRTRQCSHICLFSAELDIGTCACPEGMVLNQDSRTCIWPLTCGKDQFQCSDQRCIDSNWRCDGTPDCRDGEDEQGCLQVSPCSGLTDFYCSSEARCIPSKWKCDGEQDCTNGEDEENCEKHTCNPETEFQCGNGRCIPRIWACDHQFDCPGKEDELNCNHTCPLGTFQCKKNLECISIDWVCDGEGDCLDSSDEHGNCTVPCSSNSFRCLNHHCIPSALACNGVNDCSDNSDELDCAHLFTTSTTSALEAIDMDESDLGPPLVDENFRSINQSARNNKSASTHRRPLDACAWNEFNCLSGECIPFSLLCNGKYECLDGSDEGPGCRVKCAVNDCPHKCYETPQGPSCVCLPGFVADKNNKRGCMDIDECTAGRPCDHICVNTRGSFKCLCHEEYALRSDGRRCKPISKLIKPIYHQIHIGLEVPTPSSTVVDISSDSQPSTSKPSSSSGWWIFFGVFVVLVAIGGTVAYIFHQKRLHPKVLFERYAHQLPVKFNTLKRKATAPPSDDEGGYHDFSDGRTLSSSDHAGLLTNMDDAN